MGGSRRLPKYFSSFAFFSVLHIMMVAFPASYIRVLVTGGVYVASWLALLIYSISLSILLDISLVLTNATLSTL